MDDTMISLKVTWGRMRHCGKVGISFFIRNIAESTTIIFLSMFEYFVYMLSAYVHNGRLRNSQHKKIKVEPVRYICCSETSGCNFSRNCKALINKV